MQTNFLFSPPTVRFLNWIEKLIKVSCRIVAILFLVLVVTWGILYIYFTIKGDRDLKVAVAELKAMEIPLTPEEVIPPSIPKDQNAFYLLAQAKSDLDKKKILGALPKSNLERMWKTFRDRNLMCFSEISPKDLQIFREEQGLYKDEITAAAKALQKQAFRYDIDYQNLKELISASSSVNPRFFTQLWAEKAIIEQSEGEFLESVNTTRNIIAFHQLFLKAPLAFSYHNSAYTDELVMKCLFPAITKGKLSDATLLSIQTQFTNRDYRRAYLNSLHSDQVLIVSWIFNRLITKDEMFQKVFADELTHSYGGEILERFQAVLVKVSVNHLIPSGFWKADYAAFLRAYKLYIEEANSFSLPYANRISSTLPFYAVLSRVSVIPKFECFTYPYEVNFRVKDAQSKLIVYACALERYRLVKYSYPSTLEDLRSNFLPHLSKDLFTDELPIYKTDGKNYLIYFKGEDGEDDNGNFDKDISVATDKSWFPKKS